MEKTESRGTIAVDFDGVIHLYSKGWKDGSIYDEPVPGAIEALCKLANKRYRVVIFSTRRPAQVRRWLGSYLALDKFPEIEVSQKKPPAVAYIDDRAIRFTNWKDILNYF